MLYNMFCDYFSYVKNRSLTNFQTLNRISPTYPAQQVKNRMYWSLVFIGSIF